MVNIIIREGELEMAKELDKDGEMEIEINSGELQYVWINKKEAIKTIKHLKAIFEISN